MNLNDDYLNEICSAIASRGIETSIGGDSAQRDLLRNVGSASADEAAQYMRAAVDAVSFIAEVMRLANRTLWLNNKT